MHLRSRTHLLTALGVAALLALGALFLLPRGRPDPTPTDLCLLIVVDTLRRDALSCYGAPPDSTPAIDALAADSVRFDQAIATSCWTLPSIASILTGTWPELHKAGGQNARLTPVSPDVRMAAEIFSEHHWTTLGVANAAFLYPGLGTARGFDSYWHEHAYNHAIRRADRAVTDALTLLENVGDGRILLFVHLFDPHLDYDPAPGIPEPFTLSAGRALAPPGESPPAADVEHVRSLYAGEIRAVDAAIATLLDGLHARDLYDSATIVLTSDHGEELWEHGGFEHGHAMWDELIRVPLLLKLPADRPTAPAVVDIQVRLIDVLPTLLDLYDIEQPPTVEGSSLLPLDALESRPAFSQDPLYGSDRLSWRTDRWHYIHDRGADATKRGWLFDLSADPHEQRDLYEALPETAAELYQELARFWNDLRARGERNRTNEPLDLSPKRFKPVRDSLESLGYTGRDD